MLPLADRRRFVLASGVAPAQPGVAARASLKRAVKKVIPASVRKPLIQLARRVIPARLLYFGFAHYCPICRSRIRGFRDFSETYRGVECPVCESHPRHRLLWRYLADRLHLIGGADTRLLHFAPERLFARALSTASNIHYSSADLSSPLAMMHVDITRIPFPNNTFDAIICNHVLEHVDDDVAAMAELFRVLRPGGWAILQVPIDTTRDATLEDPSIQTPEDRLAHYWQHDHVRLYGNDYKVRLESAGFEVTMDWFVRNFSDIEVKTLGLDPTESIYLCTKPSRSPNHVAQ